MQLFLDTSWPAALVSINATKRSDSGVDEEEYLAPWKGRDGRSLRGAAAPPRLPAFVFVVFDAFCLNFGLFPKQLLATWGPSS